VGNRTQAPQPHRGAPRATHGWGARIRRPRRQNIAETWAEAAKALHCSVSKARRVGPFIKLCPRVAGTCVAASTVSRIQVVESFSIARTPNGKQELPTSPFGSEAKTNRPGLPTRPSDILWRCSTRRLSGRAVKPGRSAGPELRNAGVAKARVAATAFTLRLPAADRALSPSSHLRTGHGKWSWLDAALRARTQLSVRSCLALLGARASLAAARGRRSRTRRGSRASPGCGRLA